MDAAAARVHDPQAGHAAAGLVGGAVGAVGTLLVTVAPRGRAAPLPLLPRLLLGASASAGAALLANAASGGALGERIAGATWGNRHKAAFALRHLHRPHVLLTAIGSHRDARAMEATRFGPGEHGDDGIDAVRHAYASGLLAARLVHDHAMSAEAARAIIDDAGRAHELDGDPEDRSLRSSEMDLHNNAVGAELGTQLAASGHARPGAVFDAVVAALDDGRLLVLEGGAVRASRPHDVPPR